MDKYVAEQAAATSERNTIRVVQREQLAGPGPGFRRYVEASSEAEAAAASRSASNQGAELSPILARQKELSQLVNRQGGVVDRWLRSSDNRWAQLYRSVENSNPNFAKGIRGRILDIRTRNIFRQRFGDVPGIRIDQTIPGSGNSLRPDLYFPVLGGRKVIFDVGGWSKINDIHKYSNMADVSIPLVPVQWF